MKTCEWKHVCLSVSLVWNVSCQNVRLLRNVNVWRSVLRSTERLYASMIQLKQTVEQPRPFQRQILWGLYGSAFLKYRSTCWYVLNVVWCFYSNISRAMCFKAMLHSFCVLAVYSCKEYVVRYTAVPGEIISPSSWPYRVVNVSHLAFTGYFRELVSCTV